MIPQQIYILLRYELVPWYSFSIMMSIHTPGYSRIGFTSYCYGTIFLYFCVPYLETHNKNQCVILCNTLV